MDSIIAGGIVLGLSGLGGYLGFRWSGRRGAPWLALAVLALCVGHVIFLSDRLVLARWLPWSGTVFLALALPLPLITLFLSLLWPQLGASLVAQLRRGVPLWILTLWLGLGSFWGSPPPQIGSFPPSPEGVIAQTSESSCSAASAATLLCRVGIPATERELAGLCLTRSAGTPLLGVYRGLCQKTAGTGWRVRVLSWASPAELEAATRQGPVLISVGLDRWQRGYDPRYVTDWGWTPGKRHAVVVFGFLPEGKLDVGDPSVGREPWRVSSLAVLWNGEGIQLVSRTTP